MSSSRQGVRPKLRLPAAIFRPGINLWPPFLGAGIRVTRVSDDYRNIDVVCRLGRFNRNFFGTQFGGSLYAMTDPFFALMMLHNLGPDYVVWDKAGAIRFLRPARGDAFASFKLPKSAVDRARKATADGARHEPEFHVRVVDDAGVVVAEVDKTLYIRRHRGAGAPAPRATKKPRRARPAA
jgi:hypothetical protein